MSARVPSRTPARHARILRAALITGFGIGFGGNTASAQEPADALIAAARKRASEYKTISLRWSEVRIVPKKAAEALLTGRPGAVNPAGANLDLKLETEFLIDDTGRLRLHAVGDLPTLQDGKVGPARHDSLVVFDGLALKTYVPPGTVEHGQGFITRKQKPNYAEPKFWPVLVFYRWFSGADLPAPLDCRADTLKLKESRKEDLGLRVFRHTYPIPKTKLTLQTDFYADPAQSYRVARIEQHASSLVARVDIEYGLQRGTIAPIRWTVQQYRPGIGLAATIQVNVSDTILNSSGDDQKFTFSFPAGTRVVDSDTADVSIVKADSAERRLTNAELAQQLSNREVLENDARQGTGRWRWIIGISVLLVIVVASFYGWKRVRSRRLLGR